MVDQRDAEAPGELAIPGDQPGSPAHIKNAARAEGLAAAGAVVTAGPGAGRRGGRQAGFDEDFEGLALGQGCVTFVGDAGDFEPGVAQGVFELPDALVGLASFEGRRVGAGCVTFGEGGFGVGELAARRAESSRRRPALSSVFSRSSRASCWGSAARPSSALACTLAEFGDVPVDPRVVGEAGEEVGSAPGRVGAACFTKAEELAQGAGPQAGGGCGEGLGPGAVVHAVTLVKPRNGS